MENVASPPGPTQPAAPCAMEIQAAPRAMEIQAAPRAMATQAAPRAMDTNLRAHAAALRTGFDALLLHIAHLWGLRFRLDPRLGPALAVFYARIRRSRARFAALMDHLAAGTIRAPRARTPRPTPRRPRAPNPWPAARGWFVRLLAWEATPYRTHLAALLDHPDSAALLQAAPQARRHLRPIAHMLGIEHPLLARTTPRRTRPAPPVAPKPRATPRPFDWWRRRARITPLFWFGDPSTHPHYIPPNPDPARRRFRRPASWP